MPLLIVTDLDGTLLDHRTYEWGRRPPDVRARTAQAGVPLVLCSSKTRAEIEALSAAARHPPPVHRRERRGHRRAARLLRSHSRAARWSRTAGSCSRSGRPYPEVVQALREVAAAERVTVVGFSDMTVGDVAEECGLPVLDAQLAKLREYDEPFRLLER